MKKRMVIVALLFAMILSLIGTAGAEDQTVDLVSGNSKQVSWNASCLYDYPWNEEAGIIQAEINAFYIDFGDDGSPEVKVKRDGSADLQEPLEEVITYTFYRLEGADSLDKDPDPLDLSEFTNGEVGKVTFKLYKTYSEPSWTWGEDGKNAVATFTCKENPAEKLMLNAEGKEDKSKATKATCTEPGTTEYTATVTFRGKAYTNTKKVVTEAAAGHKFGEPVWTWSEDGKTAVATFTCEKNDATRTVKAAVAAGEPTAATCTTGSSTVYKATAKFKNKEYTDTKTVTKTAPGHVYGAPVWEWSEDHKAATATFKCEKGDDTQKLTATVTAGDPAAATCVKDGTTVYTATVKFNGKDYTDKQTVVTEKATGHQYSQVSFLWTDDFKANLVASCDHKDNTLLIPAEVTSETSAPTCTADGKTVYTATAELSGEKRSDQKTVTLKATGHSYGTPAWTWSEDLSKATAVFTCEKKDDTQTAEAAVTSVTTPATYEAEGKTVYTARVSFLGKDYTDEKSVTLPIMEKPTGDPAVTSHQLIIHYVDAEGKALTDAFTGTYAEGEKYSVTFPAVEGYTVDQAAVSGTMGAEDITVYVRYTAIPAPEQPEKMVSLICKPNGGEGDAVTTTWPVGTTVTLGLPETLFSREGCHPDGWNTEKDGSGTAYTGNEEIILDSDLTLYAQWYCEIKFEGNKGQGTMAPIRVRPGTKIELPENKFTMDCYDFIGWEGKQYGKALTFRNQEEIKVVEDLALKARWQQMTDYSFSAVSKAYKASAKTKSYTVKLKLHNKTPKDTKLVKGKKITLKVNGKTYSGKTDDKGQVTFKLNITKKGKFDAKIEFGFKMIYEDPKSGKVTARNVGASKSVKITIKQ